MQFCAEVKSLFPAGMCMQSGTGVVDNTRMQRTPTLVPGLRKLDLPTARQAIPALHAYLRECVLDGTLTPGTKLSQVALADQLGVSRTPLREVLRMLQEEGLVEIEPNQRTRVAGLDPQELDDVYASRILLETLALSMTLDGFTPKHQREAKSLLASMRKAARTADFPLWFSSHAHFHRLITAGAGASLRRQLAAFADRTIRYIRIYQLSEPAGWQSAGDVEHAAILEALAAHDDAAALSGLAHHLARTAERVLTDCAPSYKINAVPHALDMVDRRYRP
jgi:DNA-binding GntR family transcriptional regulator